MRERLGGAPRVRPIRVAGVKHDAREGADPRRERREHLLARVYTFANLAERAPLFQFFETVKRRASQLKKVIKKCTVKTDYSIISYFKYYRLQIKYFRYSQTNF